MFPGRKRWKPVHLANPAAKEFTATLGPDGGPRGYEAITGRKKSVALPRLLLDEAFSIE